MTIRELLDEAFLTCGAIKQAAKDTEIHSSFVLQIAPLCDMLDLILKQMSWQLSPAVRVGPLQSDPPLGDLLSDAGDLTSKRCEIVEGRCTKCGNVPVHCPCPHQIELEIHRCTRWRNHEGACDFGQGEVFPPAEDKT